MHAVKGKKKKKRGHYYLSLVCVWGKCHVWTGSIYHVTYGACMSARRGPLRVDLQNSSSKLAMPRKKKKDFSG